MSRNTLKIKVFNRTYKEILILDIWTKPVLELDPKVLVLLVLPKSPPELVLFVLLDPPNKPPPPELDVFVFEPNKPPVDWVFVLPPNENAELFDCWLFEPKRPPRN